MVLTGFQVLSRVFLTWAVTHSVREVRRRLLFYFHFEMLRGEGGVIGWCWGRPLMLLTVLFALSIETKSRPQE